jgi:all-trans-retinol 13,14-reductase
MANTYSIFSSYIVLKPGSFENISHNIYAYNQNDVWNNEIADDQWPRSFMMLTQSEQEGQTHASGITVISPMRYDMVKEWEGTTFKNRPQSYLDFKLEMQERLLKLLEKQWPSLRDKILAIESNTPLTYEHYTHTPQGSLYGIIRSNAEPLHTQIAPKTKIANLTFVGQNIDIHGVLGVTVGAFMAAGLYVNLEQLIQKVKEA